MICAPCPAWSTRPRSTPCRCPTAAGAKASPTSPTSVPEDKRKQEGAAIYMVDEHGIKALGVQVVAGRDFNAGDVSVRTKDGKGQLDSVIITQALADAIHPDGAVGKTMYSSLVRQRTARSPSIGVIERLQAPWVGWDKVEHVDPGAADAGRRVRPGRLALPDAHRARPARRGDEGGRDASSARSTPAASCAACNRSRRCAARAIARTAR